MNKFFTHKNVLLTGFSFVPSAKLLMMSQKSQQNGCLRKDNQQFGILQHPNNL